MRTVADVPCDGCTLCCQNSDLIIITDHDDITSYDVQFAPGRGFALKHTANGDCVYLDRELGCTIHDRRPMRCREMDCRNLAKIPKRTLERFVTDGLVSSGVIARGRELLREEER